MEKGTHLRDFLYPFSLAGSPSGGRYDSLTFYEGQNYNGKQQSFFHDAPSFRHDDFGR